jgi:hypothetical protein
MNRAERRMRKYVRFLKILAEYRIKLKVKVDIYSLLFYRHKIDRTGPVECFGESGNTQSLL